MSNQEGQVCSLCKLPINPDDSYVVCSKCGLFYHSKCWQENAACTTFGCDGQPEDSSQASVGTNLPAMRKDQTHTTKCTSCSAENSTSSRFCVKCGYSLTQSTSAPPPAESMCRSCGFSNKLGSAYCGKCGATLASSGPQCAAPQFPPPFQQGTAMPAAEVPTYLWQAIVCTLLCCLPGGIVAIIYATKVNNKLQLGDYEGAVAASNSAKKWCWISFGAGIAVSILYVLVVGVGSILGS